MNSVDFLSIGDTQYDTILSLAPEEVSVRCRLNREDCKMCLDYAGKIPVSELHAMVAGNAANVAVTAARLDGTVALWTLLGDDEIADEEIQTLQREGITTAWMEKVPGAESNRSTVITVNGERTILVYHAPRRYVLPKNLPSARIVYFTSMGPGAETLFPAVIRYVERTGARLVYQPGTYQLRLGAERAQPLLALVNCIIMNKEEAQAYTHHRAGKPLELLRALKRLGAKIAVVTDGTNGSYATDGETSWSMGIRPEIPRIEATGAGDAFASAFGVALLEGATIPEALRWGTFNAEGVIQEFGPQKGILKRKQLEELCLRYPQFVAKEIERKA
ncbi:carbohydrate kinase family protein [Candidatus Berkelbacteria bacterium]|nr:carbohydrate kinase family protein [Candidatus Berkelbacteria bacterium]